MLIYSFFYLDAWTETDNTVYTLSCAGTEGFLHLLPVYLDHILFPSLTKSAFITEVYGITGTGEDNGAVYCEMQGRENSGESRGSLEMFRNAYPGHGYSMETGGIMKNIRDSLTIEKIREFHKKFYRSENLALIVAGKVSIEEVEKAISPIEEKILKRKDAYPKFVKPWQTPVKPLEESKDVKILFPSDEEEYGIVSVAFHGPQATTDYNTLTACYVLMKYLCDTSVSPIQQTFIEIEDSYASSVSYHITENSTSLLYFTFENVPVDKIDSVRERLNKLLSDIANGVEKVDENRLKIVFDKYILERLSSLENSPHDEITFHNLGDFLYAGKNEDFAKRLNVTDVITELQKEPLDYWLNLLRKFFVDNKSVTVRAVPSTNEKEKLAKQESERLEKRREELGEEGLKKLGQELSDAIKENDREPTLEMLTSLPIPSTKSINFHTLEINKKNTAATNKVDLSRLPFYIEAYNIKTNFVYVCATFDTSKFSLEQRKYLLLFLDLIVESPIQLGDKLLPYESVVAALEEDMISYETSLGVQNSSRFGSGTFSQTVTFHMQVEIRKFETAVEWMTNLFFNSVFTQERVHIIASKLVNDIASSKRNGYSMAREILKAIYYKKNTNAQANSVLSQHKFLSDLLEQLKNPDQCSEILKSLNEIREMLIPSMTVHVSANFDKIKDIETPFKSLTEKFKTLPIPPVDYLPVVPDSALMNGGNIEGDFTGTIVGMGCIESGFLYCSSPGLSDFLDKDLPPLLLYLQYLSQLEGPMWKKIRKNSYSYHIVPRPNEGLISFVLYRATNIYESFKDAKTIIEGELNEGIKFDDTLLESAKSSLIFEIIEREKTVSLLDQQALLSSFKGVPLDYNKKLVNDIAAVSHEDLRKVARRFFKSIFNPDTAKIVIVCHPDKVESIKTQFEDFGHNLKTCTSLETSILNNCS